MATVKVRDLKPGMQVDLKGDKYADPEENGNCWEFEYGRVGEIDVETPQCICVYFINGEPVGFPPDHELKLAD